MSTRQRVWLSVAIFVVIVTVAWAIYYPFSPGGRQRANMRRAQRHISETLAAQVAADPRFAAIELKPYTVGAGSLKVSGAVATEADAEALRSLIRASDPPVEVSFSLHVEHLDPTPPEAARPEG